MAHFSIDATKREALTASRAEELLRDLSAGVTSVKLSGVSFGDGSATVAAEALSRAAVTLRDVDLSDIIASRPEDEAKRALTVIGDALSICDALRSLNLSDNALGAKGIRALGSLLAGRAELQELLLCNNGLAADAGDLIASAVLETAPTKLKKLHFHNNLLETAGSVALAPIVENSPMLEDFRFSSLRLGRDGSVRISKALRPRLGETLRHLNLSDNTFGEEGAEALADVLGDAAVLETLLLRDDALGDDGVQAVCKALVHGAPRLFKLDVSGNEMEAGAARQLGKLVSAGRLTEVFAEDNELGSSGACALAREISDEARVEVLDVSGSEIGGRGALRLATAVQELEGLKTLRMDANCIPRSVVEQVEELLGERLGGLEENDEEGEESEEEEDEEDEDEDEDAED